MDTPPVPFGVSRFSYSREQVEEIARLLPVNSWDESKVFFIVWMDGGGFKDRSRNEAPLVLNLIGTVKAAMRLDWNDPNKVWGWICEAADALNAGNK